MAKEKSKTNTKNIMIFITWFLAFTLYLYLFLAGTLRLDLGLIMHNETLAWILSISSIVSLLITLSITEKKEVKNG